MAVVVIAEHPRAVTSEDKLADYYRGSMEKTIVLASPNRLIIEIGGGRIEYGPGDRVHLRWEDGIAYVNDMQVRPVPGAKPELWSAEKARRVFGEPPMILRYVQEHEGEGTEDELWTRALSIWNDKIKETTDDAANQYARLIEGDPGKGIPPMDYDRAVAAVADTLRQKIDLVRAVTIEPTRHTELSIRTIVITWEGENVEPIIDLSGEYRGPREEVPPLFARIAFEDLCWVLDRLTRVRRDASLIVRIDERGYATEQKPIRDAEVDR